MKRRRWGCCPYQVLSTKGPRGNQNGKNEGPRDSSLRNCINEIAKQLGADYAFNVTKHDAVSEINRLTDGIGCDVYMEVSGNNESLELGCEVLRKSGKMLVMGVYEGKASLDFNYVSELKELQIIGGHLSPNKFPLTIKYIAEGKVNAKKMVTHQFPLKDFKKAFEQRRATFFRDLCDVRRRPTD